MTFDEFVKFSKENKQEYKGYELVYNREPGYLNCVSIVKNGIEVLRADGMLSAMAMIDQF